MFAALNGRPDGRPTHHHRDRRGRGGRDRGVLVMLRRSMRVTGLALGVSAAVAVAIVVGAVLVGGSLTPPSPAAAAEPGKGIGNAYDPAFDRRGLPTLDLP